ncbi:MAG: hypothetical protein PWP23_2064 [Candidatus Sumerlaeota bacterium]|nr:hypothetical protein [Candidatus Sumerlaeota bacterium]
MPSLATLPFDAARRFAALLYAAGQLDLPAASRFLDVGGYPGTLARLLRERFPTWSGLTVDTVAEESLADYQCADGARLPFDDGAFDVVFSSDTLEHVPGGDRAAFVAECARVSRRAVILGAPFGNDIVAAIEASLDASHRRATGHPHPWLGEHVENVLPSLEETCRAFAAHGMTPRLALNAPLTSWLVWQWLSLARETSGALDAAWHAGEQHLAPCADVDALETSGEFAWYNGGTLPFLPYRWIIIADRMGAPESACLPHSGDYPPARGAECLALSEVLRAVVEGARGGGVSGEALQAGLDAQARKALELAEAEVLRARAAAPRSLFGLFAGRRQ